MDKMHLNLKNTRFSGNDSIHINYLWIRVIIDWNDTNFRFDGARQEESEFGLWGQRVGEERPGLSGVRVRA